MSEACDLELSLLYRFDEVCGKCGHTAAEHVEWFRRPKAVAQVVQDLAAYKAATDEVGLKYDSGKVRWELLPEEPIELIAQVMTHGAAKYDADNWRHVVPFKNRYYAALRRHLRAWRAGEQTDPDSGLPHLAHAACNIIFLLANECDGADILRDERE
jgi:hypothetical protein